MRGLPSYVRKLRKRLDRATPRWGANASNRHWQPFLHLVPSVINQLETRVVGVDRCNASRLFRHPGFFCTVLLLTLFS